MRYVLYNPLSSHCLSLEQLEKEMKLIDPSKEIQLLNCTEIKDGDAFLASLKEDDDVVLSGGDGTLNKFVNAADFSKVKNHFYLHKAGNGNDFLRDVNNLESNFIEITEYIKDLPTVTVNGKTSKFINGVGFGIDGMVCVESDKLKAKGKKNINYTSLSIKLLLLKFKRANAEVVVDGKKYNFKHVFIGSAMFGRYYGGGMNEAPNQDRKSDHVSVVIWHNLWSLSALMLFPKIFKGEHVLNKKHVTVLTGKEVMMTYSRPTDLQIDGESIHAVTTYSVKK